MRAGTLVSPAVGAWTAGAAWAAGGVVTLPTTTFGLVSSELYDPASGKFSLAGNTSVGRELATSTTLPNGTVLVTGGQANAPSQVIYSTAEIYTPVIQGLVTSQTGVTFRAAEDFEALYDLCVLRKVPFFADVSTRFGELAETHRTFVVQDPSDNLVEFKHYRDPRMMY